jgi:hypothetical protein
VLTPEERKQCAERLNARSVGETFVQLPQPGLLPSEEAFTHLLVGNIITFNSQTQLPGLEQFRPYLRTTPGVRHLITFAFCAGPDGHDACVYDFTYTLDETGNVIACDEPELSQEKGITVKTSRYCTRETTDGWKFDSLVERGDGFLTAALEGRPAVLPAGHRFNQPGSVKVIKG